MPSIDATDHASVSSVAEWKERRTGLPPPIRLPGRTTQHISFHPIVRAESQLPGRQEVGPSAECSAQLIPTGRDCRSEWATSSIGDI